MPRDGALVLSDIRKPPLSSKASTNLSIGGQPSVRQPLDTRIALIASGSLEHPGLKWIRFHRALNAGGVI